MRKDILFVVVVVLLASATSLLAQNESSAGQQLFRARCAICHGADGTGKTSVGRQLNIPDLHSSQVQSKTDQQLKTIIENGKQKMPAFKTMLGQQQIKDVLAYVRELGKAGAAAQR